LASGCGTAIIPLVSCRRKPHSPSRPTSCYGRGHPTKDRRTNAIPDGDHLAGAQFPLPSHARRTRCPGGVGPPVATSSPAKGERKTVSFPGNGWNSLHTHWHAPPIETALRL